MTQAKLIKYIILIIGVIICLNQAISLVRQPSDVAVMLGVLILIALPFIVYNIHKFINRNQNEKK